MKAFMKKWAEKLSNFKLLARIMICMSAVVILVSVGAFVAFQFSRGVDPDTSARVTAFGAQKEGRQLIGMFFFLILTAALVMGIVIAYQSKEFAFPKTKMAPNKSLPVLCVANGVLCVIAAIFAILAVVADVPVNDSPIEATKIGAAWYVIAVFYLLAGVVHLAMLLPVLKSHYFMPKFGEEEKK